MLDDASKLPNDPTELKTVAVQLATTVKSQALEIARLKHQLAGHRIHRFGPKSETSDQLDLQLRLEEEETAAARMAPSPEEDDPEPNEKPKRKPLPPELPRIDEILSPGETCSCGGKLRAFSEDATEELEYVPGRFIVNRFVRPRMACKDCEKIVQAPLPSRPIERGRPGPGLLAHVLVNKYADHCPLYRQSQIFAREGIDLNRSTLSGWMGQSTALLEVLADAIGRYVQNGQAIFADDTTIKMQAKRKCTTARMWTYVRDEQPWGSNDPPAAWYQFSTDREGRHPADHLSKYNGWMHADGYAGFNRLYENGAVQEVACMAHVRRKFVDIFKASGLEVAEEAIKRIALLYAVEKEARGKDPAERVRLRQGPTNFQRIGRMVAGSVATHTWQIRSCESYPICADPHEEDARLSRSWRAGVGQQHSRKIDALCGSGTQKLPLRRVRRWRKSCRDRLHSDRNRQTEQRRSAGMADRCPYSYRRSQNHSH